MNIVNSQWKTELPVAPLPQLIKQSSTYKLIVPEKVEEKIRYLIRKFPHTEWSGVLFTTHTGGFETNDLVITCQDIYPMDLGSAGFTEFKMTSDVSSYIAQNLELFDCDLQLVHSHHGMGAFFSGTDLETLRKEGNDTNCFVSLVVDTKGTYVAAITRKVKQTKEITTTDLGSSYEFFGDGTVPLVSPKGNTTVQKVDNEVIEYFMLDVERHEVSNPLEYLDTRFESIESNKKKTAAQPLERYKKDIFTKDTPSTSCHWDFLNDNYSFQDYRKEMETKRNEPMLWDDTTMEDLEVQGSIDKEAVHRAVSQMVTCSFILGDKFNLDTWIKHHLKNHYEKIFKEDGAFDEWVTFITEFQINHFDGYFSDDFSLLAKAMQDELAPYADISPYIAAYCKELDLYVEIEPEEYAKS